MSVSTSPPDLCTVSADMPLAEVLGRLDPTRSSPVLVLTAGRLVGIVTSRDIVRALASQRSLGRPIAEVMTTPVITLSPEQAEDLGVVWDCLRRHGVRHLPVVDSQGTVIRLLTLEHLLPSLHLAQDWDQPQANHALTQELDAGKRVEMELRRSQAQLQEALLGAIAAISSFRQVEAAAAQTENAPWVCTYYSPGALAIYGYTAEELLADPPLWLARIHPEDQPLVELSTLLSQLTTRPILNETCRFYHKDGTLHWIAITATARRDAQTHDWSITLVATDVTDRQRAEDQLRSQSHYEQAIHRAIQKIRSSLNLDTVYTTTVTELAQLLSATRVSLVRYQAPAWQVVADHGAAPLSSRVGTAMTDANYPLAKRLRQMETVYLPEAGLEAGLEAERSPLNSAPGTSGLVLPLTIGAQLWGSIHLGRASSWQPREAETLQRIIEQLMIAIQQAELHSQEQRLNMSLERKAQARAAQLQLAYQFESTLKQVTDKVRDSLDETQILQGAVEALAKSLKVGVCNAALFDLEQRLSTIKFEAVDSLPPSRGQVFYMDHFPELYTQLLQGQYFQFCSLMPNPNRGRVAMLACPILDDQGVLGSLWLINRSFYGFAEQDIRLVQQVATQCAIALRQARLYQAAQAQAQAMTRLDRLKDDFLSTISHELRTPMSSIQLAVQMLENNLRQQHLHTGDANSLSLYVQILKEQSEREIHLINNLLELTQPDPDGHRPVISAIYLASWLPHVTAPFVDRIRLQQQQLDCQLPADLPPLRADLCQLDRIVGELLNNACKYTPAGERIQVSARVDAEHMEITVANSGVEILPGERDRIFERFYRIPNNNPWKHGGTGLGLALVRKQLQPMQGSISVHSQSGWTFFTVRLPLNLATAAVF
jgi:PAS domain S-box-containing protein